MVMILSRRRSFEDDSQPASVFIFLHTVVIQYRNHSSPVVSSGAQDIREMPLNLATQTCEQSVGFFEGRISLSMQLPMQENTNTV
jgi:hypothetical protein